MQRSDEYSWKELNIYCYNFMNSTLHTRQSLIQNNKYQVLNKYSCFSWWWAHSRRKHVRKRNKHTKKNCATSWLYLQDYCYNFVHEANVHNGWWIFMLKQCMYYPRILVHSFNFGSKVKIILVREMWGYQNSFHKDFWDVTPFRWENNYWQFRGA